MSTKKVESINRLDIDSARLENNRLGPSPTEGYLQPMKNCSKWEAESINLILECLRADTAENMS